MRRAPAGGGAETRRCLAYAGAHQAVEVKRAEHRPCRQGPPVEAFVESFDHGINNVAQAVRVRFHTPEYAPRRAGAHDRNCCGGPRYVTAESVIASPRSMIAKPSRNSASVMHRGGFVKK